MKAEDYEAWYETARGRWVAETEYRLLIDHLRPRRGETLLDVGCGTGHFTRRFASEPDLAVIGIDPKLEWLRYAMRRRTGKEVFVAGDALRLPLSDKSMDIAISVTALCFIPDQRAAAAELIRVTRRRFAVGLLNRRSALYRDKGRHGGRGAYAGAHWHTVEEAMDLFTGLAVQNLRVQTAVTSASGGVLARALERVLPMNWPWGAFLIVSADIADGKASLKTN